MLASSQILAFIWFKAKKTIHLVKCYSKLANVLVKKIGMPRIWYTNILTSNQTGHVKNTQEPTFGTMREIWLNKRVQVAHSKQ